jgi:tetratricopeptide (TPR) repeat protein
VWLNVYSLGVSRGLPQWHDPLVLSRLWCLWELHCAVATGSTFAICLSPEQEQAFCQRLLEDYGRSAMQALSKIDVNAAHGNPKDSALILGGIRASPGGTEGLNETAVEQLREKFVAAIARAWVASLRCADGSLETAKAVAAGKAVAVLLGHLGHWEEARDLRTQVTAGFERLEGPLAPNTMDAKTQLAYAMQETGQVSQARELYESVLEQQLATLGPESGAVLITQTNLAVLLGDKLNEWALSLPLREAVVTGRTKLNGPEAEQTLLVKSNLAVAYQNLGRHGEAKEAYVSVLAAQQKLLGERHPDSMRTQLNLAKLLHDELGEREEGLALLREVVAVRTTVLGGGHALTRKAADTLARWEALVSM